MTLPSSGTIKLSQVNTELANAAGTQISLGAASVRSLGGVASGVIMASNLYGKTKTASGIVVYYGLSSTAVATAALIAALTQASISALPYNFSLNAGSGQYQYFALPVSVGQALFYDTVGSFYGGWDGAHNDAGLTLGPITLTINSVLCYVYRTDFAALGASSWQVQAS